jgi:hypothetical protein
MVRLISVVVITFALVACASSSTDDAVSSLQPGMSKEQVVAKVGKPGDRTFRGNDEALSYAKIAGFGQCKYTTLWFRDGKLVGVTTRRGGSVAGCGLGSEPVDWNEMPAAQ